MKINHLLNNAYIPYSGDAAAAVVQSQDGNYFPGCRVENISYPISISAIQSALFCCLSEGEHPEKIWASAKEIPHQSFWGQEFGVTFKAWNSDEIQNISITNVSLDEDLDIDDTLVDLLDAAWVPESDFPVTAIVKSDVGYFGGVNVECSSWPMGLCAERVAISKAISYGSKNIQELHIHSRDGDFSSPCGSCRQVIMEHMPDQQVHLMHADHTKSVHFTDDLLPYSFQSYSLNKE